jgi:hypothetical protein
MGQTTSYLICGGALVYLIFMLRFLFLSFRSHNDLIRYEYEHVREQWEKDGEPRGMLFWRAPHPPKSFLRRYFLSNPGLTSMLWTFVTPKWVEGFPEAKKHLRNMRLNTLWWNIGILLPILIVLLIGVIASE